MPTLTRLFLLALPLVWTTAIASETDELTRLLDHFLENVTQVDAHDRFWADDLVYTSSSGERTTKPAILASVGEAAGDEPDGPLYSAEEVDVRVYGNTAVVAFRLVAKPRDDSAEKQYLNTGTFLKRNDSWQVVAWQATRTDRQE